MTVGLASGGCGELRAVFDDGDPVEDAVDHIVTTELGFAFQDPGLDQDDGA